MKNALLEIIEIVDQYANVIFAFVTIIAAIVGIVKNWQAIKSSSRPDEQNRGVVSVICILLYFYLFLSFLLLVLSAACYFMFPLDGYLRIMYLLTLLMGVITGLLLNAKTIVSSIRSKQIKAIIHIALVVAFIVITFSIL